MKKRRWLVVLNIFIASFIAFLIIFLVRANRPLKRAEAEATKLAKQHTSLKRVDDFYYFNREETFFSIVGQDKKKRAIVVIVPQSGNKIRVYEQKDGLTENEALKIIKEKKEPHKITKISLGIYKDKPVWEVVTEVKEGYFNYYMVDFMKGNISYTVENF